MRTHVSINFLGEWLGGFAALLAESLWLSGEALLFETAPRPRRQKRLAQKTRRDGFVSPPRCWFVLQRNSIGLLIVLVLLGVPKQSAAQQVVDKMVATVNAGVKTELITY